MVIVWNYKEGTMKGNYETHKVGVVDLCFTCNSDFLVSLGGRDDGNVVVWDVQKSSLICGILHLILLSRTDLHEKFQWDVQKCRIFPEIPPSKHITIIITCICGNYNIDVMLMLVGVCWVSTCSFTNNLCVTKPFCVH